MPSCFGENDKNVKSLQKDERSIRDGRPEKLTCAFSSGELKGAKKKD